MILGEARLPHALTADTDPGGESPGRPHPLVLPNQTSPPFVPSVCAGGAELYVICKSRARRCFPPAMIMTDSPLRPLELPVLNKAPSSALPGSVPTSPMSRLTANPFQRPPMFQFPQRVPAGTGLQSPPDTEPVPPNLSMSTANASVAVGLDTLRFPEPEPHAYAEPPRPRKGPTLSYYNSGIREARERTVQRSIKSFIVVLPPPSLIDEHGPLGHTLSTGPRHRLRDGILLPLFPTVSWP